MNKQNVIRAFATATVALLGLLLSTSILLAANADRIPWTGPVPKADCGRWDWTESGLQGQTTPWERESGDSEGGYNCNLELVGQFQGEGARSQGGPAYIDHCAYYLTDNKPLQKRPGVVVVDASDPRHPRPTTYLDDPVFLDPHETLKANQRRKLIAGSRRDSTGFAVYDASADCARPVLKGSIDLPGNSAHMGNFAPDGMTYYIGQSFRGLGGFMHIVDLADPSNPKQLPPWQFLGDGRPHGVWLNEAGTRLYAGQPGLSADARPVLVRTKRAGDPGRQRLSVPSPQSPDPDCQQALLGRPRASGGDVPLQPEWAPVRRQLGRVRRQWWCWRCPGRLCPGGVPAWLSECHRHHRREEP